MTAGLKHQFCSVGGVVSVGRFGFSRIEPVQVGCTGAGDCTATDDDCTGAGATASAMQTHASHWRSCKSYENAGTDFPGPVQTRLTARVEHHA